MAHRDEDWDRYVRMHGSDAQSGHRWWRHQRVPVTNTWEHVLGVERLGRRIAHVVRRELWRGWVRAGANPRYYEAVIIPWRVLLFGPPDEAFAKTPPYTTIDLASGE